MELFQGRSGRSQKWPPRHEEVVNAITHGVGLALAVVGLVVLVVLATLRGGTAWHVVSCSVYGATLVLLYTASTLYHGVRSPRAKRILRILDHSAIYLLIAGTYTPFMLISLRGGWGWSIFGVIWGLAITGVILKPFIVDRFPIVSPALYILMGWLVIIAVKPILASVGWGVFLWVILGGIAYTGGIIFYALDGKLRFNHAIWHVCVFAGSLFHFVAVLMIIPMKIG